MKIYAGLRSGNGIFVAVEKENTHSRSEQLTHINYHSPDGFEWGYGGSGPADLALAIMADFLEEDPVEVLAYAKGQGEPSGAVHAHQQFKDKFIVGLAKDTWKLKEKDIKEWYYAKIGALCKECRCGMKESDGCLQLPIPMKDGRVLKPILHGKEERADWGADGKRCHDCGAKVGHYHHPGCDVEECPSCHGQILGCECLESDEKEEVG